MLIWVGNSALSVSNDIFIYHPCSMNSPSKRNTLVYVDTLLCLPQKRKKKKKEEKRKEKEKHNLFCTTMTKSPLLGPSIPPPGGYLSRLLRFHALNASRLVSCRVDLLSLLKRKARARVERDWTGSIGL